jgi:hypothetical protein
MTTATKPERYGLNTILAGVYLAAAAVSWTHVAHWTMDTLHVGPWQGYTNSAVSELVPLASCLVIRAKRRTGPRYPFGPIATLAAFGLFSLMAQVAEVPATWQAWLLAALPCLGDAAVIKLVLSMPTSQATEHVATVASTELATAQPDLTIDLTTTPPTAHHTGHLAAVPPRRPARSFDVARLHTLLAEQPRISQVQAARILDASRTTIRKHWPAKDMETVTA